MGWNPPARTSLVAVPAVLVTAAVLVGMHEPSGEPAHQSDRVPVESTQQSPVPTVTSTVRSSEHPEESPTHSSQHPEESPIRSSGPPVESSVSSSDPSAEAGRQSRAEHRILELTNRARARAGCPPLRLDPALSRSARAHSRDMARHDFLAHRSSAGLGHIERAKDAGYRSNYVGENVAVGNNTAEETFRQWMTSPEHRANIMDCSFTELGVGYVRDSSGEWEHYWTQNLGRPREK
ncbi:uncharacterized protein YkwD [Halopolyspora algeriensis]|uniref:Uncharacterized protein YkwD n=1 Tax=Halopolyspora algeriensis TaxID=1500506 RepID=A0A368VMQ3_9ACTN|nr:CAP domain-containing protein [Halopolyspora algeriensis]RCW42808.1 uncharacterized protein YkwD [Halopolyspora algeriensis]TQM56722.1 uncharacterized protein YkwD [Halopolyspora algeriensis]